MSGCASVGGARPQVLVVGAGWGGSTVAKYVRMLSDHSIDVMMIEPNEAFVSCPISNLVLSRAGGSWPTSPTATTTWLQRHGVRLVRGRVEAVDAGAAPRAPGRRQHAGLRQAWCCRPAST
jgi:sulfide dehydrogenase [flavocytochrome c] flavoprotein subunit